MKPNNHWKSRAKQAHPAGSAHRFPWLPVTVYFLIGLLCRSMILTGVHNEGDEIIYSALVQELEAGRGYTLQATPLVRGGWLSPQYGKALFFHPPGGIALFWLLYRVFGNVAYPLAQMLSYALFFWSMLFLGSVVHSPLRGAKVHFLAALSAFTPIMTHVTSRFWLDGPLLAFSTLASALFMFAVVRSSVLWATLAGLVMGYASWIKVPAFLILPGLLLLAWSVTESGSRRTTLRLGLLFTCLAVLIQLAWELWYWAAAGSPSRVGDVAALVTLRPWDAPPPHTSIARPTSAKHCRPHMESERSAPLKTGRSLWDSSLPKGQRMSGVWPRTPPPRVRSSSAITFPSACGAGQLPPSTNLSAPGSSCRCPANQTMARMMSPRAHTPRPMPRRTPSRWWRFQRASRFRVGRAEAATRMTPSGNTKRVL